MDTKQSTISIQIPNPMLGIEKAKNSLLLFANEIYNGPVRNSFNTKKSFFSSLNAPRLPKFKFNKKLFLKIVLPVFAVLILVLVVANVFRSFPGTTAGTVTSEGVSLPKPIAVETLDKKYNFPLRDEEGEEVGSFDYTIENAELRKQIIVNGQRATSIEGRVFLILNLKVVNNLDQPIQLNTRDYIRVVTNGNEEELLAPDIHNDPVETQAISTKYTRLGLAINDTDTKNPIILQVGEIDGEKQTIEIGFK